jgi:hypothetical protein
MHVLGVKLPMISDTCSAAARLLNTGVHHLRRSMRFTTPLNPTHRCFHRGSERAICVHQSDQFRHPCCRGRNWRKDALQVDMSGRVRPDSLKVPKPKPQQGILMRLICPISGLDACSARPGT